MAAASLGATSNTNNGHSKRPARAAVIARTLKEALVARDAFRALKDVADGAHAPPHDIRLFSLAGGTVGLSAKADEAASLLHTEASGLFDLVYVDPNVKVFDTTFGQALVASMQNLAAPGGTLLLPDWSSQAKKGGVSPERLAQWLGGSASAVGQTHVRFCAGHPLTPPPSVLSWYLRQGAQLVLEEMFMREGGIDLDAMVADPLVSDYLLSGSVVTSGVRGARSGEEATELSGVLNDIVSSHAYLIGGVSYKAALIRHILDETMPGRAGLAYADIGGGFGALAAELLASSPPERFAHAVTRDIAAQNIILSRSLYAGLNAPLAGRYKFSLGPAETFAFEDGYDVISFVGSLLYVDKSELPDLMARIWASIRPGGVFIVHENIKSPAFTRDFDVMFEAAEIDGLLTALGPVTYYHSNAFVRLPAETIGNKTVFRVVSKPA